MRCNGPSVSVVTPFFNAATYLQEAIESVLSQTYESWELLLVDDGSTDSGTEIALRYAESYPGRIRYLQHEGHANRGKSTSRNLGLSDAQGLFVGFLDADDVFLPQKLERQVASFERHPEAGMVYGNTLYWHSWTGRPEDAARDYAPDLWMPPEELVAPPRLLRVLLGLAGAVPCICSFLVKRSIVEAHGGFDESIQHLYEDQVFLAKIFCSETVRVDIGHLEKYRQREDSSWHVSVSEGQDEIARLVFLEWLQRYLGERLFRDRSIEEALRSELRRCRSARQGNWRLAVRPLLTNVKRWARGIH